MATRQHNNRQRGKAHERATAKAVGGIRIGIMGGEDVSHTTLSIECKSVKRFVGRGWMEQCVRNNTSDTKVPLVVIHTTGAQHSSDLALLKLTDLVKMQDEIKRLENKLLGR